LSNPWVQFTSEAQKKWFLEKVNLACYIHKTEYDLEYLFNAPVSRVAYTWKQILRNYYLSPFAMAGITKHSPQEVLEQALLEEKEFGFRTDIILCSDTMLPVMSYDFFCLRPDHNKGRRRASMEQLWRSYNRDSSVYSTDSFEEMLAAFGGPDWKIHCTRTFDPVEKGRRNHISLADWATLRRAYTGRAKKPKDEEQA